MNNILPCFGCEEYKTLIRQYCDECRPFYENKGIDMEGFIAEAHETFEEWKPSNTNNK